MQNRAWIISVNMGYGHQRTAFPLRGLAEGEIINANDYKGIPEQDRKIWERTRKFYEFISRFSETPFIGKIVFSVYNQFQKILNFYPKRDLSKPNFTLNNIYFLLEKGWGRDLINKLKVQKATNFQACQLDKNGASRANLPIISTFFIPAFMAEFFNYPGKIFCIICDADISRVWAPLNPKESKIKYFAPNERVTERLKLYGVKEENIFLTGYPLPLENIGSEKMEILKEDLKHRILNLDPKKKYFEKYQTLIEKNLGRLAEKSDHPLTILFSVGGAGAQKEIGIKIAKSLAKKILSREVKLILAVGIKEKIKEYFINQIRKLNLFGSNVEIIFEKNIENYFQKFNLALRKTDILWTKPSELSFYSALGIPIIIAPPIGSQEEFNMRWLLKSGFGILQEDPNYTDQWFFDWLEKGYLAEMALEAFIEGEKFGTKKIEEIIKNES